MSTAGASVRARSSATRFAQWHVAPPTATAAAYAGCPCHSIIRSDPSWKAARPSSSQSSPSKKRNAGSVVEAAVQTYTESGGTGNAVEDLDKDTAVVVFLERYEVCEGLFHGFDWSVWTAGSAADRLKLLPAAQEHVLALDDGRVRCLKAVRELSQAFALATPRDEVLAKRDGVGFFQSVRVALMKRDENERTPSEDLDQAVRQIVANAVSPDGVIDIFEAAGLKKPDISILSEDFLAEAKTMERKNLAVELLRKLLQGEITKRRKQNVVQARSFSEMLEEALRKYRNRAIEAAQVIEELIELAREMREANARGEELGLREDELAFYDGVGDE